MIHPVADDRSAVLMDAAALNGSPYVSYSYAYPHKTAYRTLDPPVELQSLWSREPTDALFLYLHVPFCEHRCGFCNLFTQANPETGISRRYLQQLRVEAEQVAAAVPAAEFARLAIGGGTPTFLELFELEELLKIITQVMQVDAREIPVSVEVSPSTISEAKLDLLREFGVDRISIGVQSFDERESRRLGRPQARSDVDHALDLIRRHRFPILNVDLIYGGQGQTADSWLETLDEALSWQPEEIYLYPLYVRPLTGLGRRDRTWDDHRLELYRIGRDRLGDAGYRQVSMRMFERDHDNQPSGPAYCCQADGMVGLGCGARSYTSRLHYSTEFAVSRGNVRSILKDYFDRDSDSFSAALHGIRLGSEEQRRRYCIMSLLQSVGVCRNDYRQQFGSDVLEDLPELSVLPQMAMATIGDDRIRLTAKGLERSDAIGPWLYSASVRERMSAYELS